MIVRAMPAGFGPLSPSGTRLGAQLSPARRDAEAVMPLPWPVAAPLIAVVSGLLWFGLYRLIALV